MKRFSRSFTLRSAPVLAMAMLAAPVSAEQLSFDHRLVPPLKAVLDGGNAAMIDYNASNPRYVTDVIAVRGRSASDWDEALVIIVRTPNRQVGTVQAWQDDLRRDAARRCEATLSSIASDAISATFERSSATCPGDYPPHAIYRIVQGQRSLFLLAVLSREVISPQAREQWLALLASAHLE